MTVVSPVIAYATITIISTKIWDQTLKCDMLQPCVYLAHSVFKPQVIVNIILCELPYWS